MNNLKKYFYIIYFYIILNINKLYAKKPEILDDVDSLLPSSWIDTDAIAKNIGWWLIETMIRYVAIIAVITLMVSWIMYLISGWEEEKVKKAKNWIMWSLAWVLVSISAMWIIQIINNIKI